MSLIADEMAMGKVSPALLVDAMFGFRKTAAIKAAIELDVFTAIGGNGATAHSLGTATGASERGMRILCDFLVVGGFLTKTDDLYELTPSSQVFLNRQSPAYMGSAIEFVAAPEIARLFLDDPSAFVRNGGSVGLANVAPDNPVWIRFARAMGSFVASSAESLAAEIAQWPTPPRRVLDIAAGHGLFGIEVAKVLPKAEIVAVDWRSVLALAEENAKHAGIADRFRILPGNAFEVDWGTDYDLILLPNFLHHFDLETCVVLLQKVRGSLSAQGNVVAVEFVPNDDRVSPPFPASFSWEMLATTPRGDAYTEKDLMEMARSAGFSGISTRALPPSPASLIFFKR
ncbi:methyltransferase [Rhizobium sp. 2YAF20]|uniref:methyltransferase n=1 Tax=Rhizobium sp. 2YAF20 TaxID=3233027 RepID=UPI003F9B8367